MNAQYINSDRFYLACGKTVRAWAKFDGVLFLYFQALLQANAAPAPTQHMRARVMWTRMQTFKERRRMLRKLARSYTDAETLAQLDKFLDRAMRLASIRNMIVHTGGGVDTISGSPFFFGDEEDEDLGIGFNGLKEFKWPVVENWTPRIVDLEQEMLDWVDAFSRRVKQAPMFEGEKKSNFRAA